MLKVVELFGGIGAFSKALERLGVEHEVVDYVEIDKYATKSFNAVHGTNFKPQDITQWDKDIECDIIMHGSPCQDFSLAGKQAGGDKGSGTRSSLLYETLRIVEKTHPKYVIWENVKNLLSKKHIHNWKAYVDEMNRLGYETAAEVLNAKDFGVPQNRERVFTVSIRKDLNQVFWFPEKMPLEKKLKDILEDEVDEKYYLSDDQLERLTRSTFEQSKRIYSTEGTAPTLSTMQGGQQEPKIMTKAIGYNPYNDRNIYDVAPTQTTCCGSTTSSSAVLLNAQGGVAIKTANSKGFDMANNGDSIDLAYPNSTTRRGRVGHGVSKTLATSDNMGTLDGARIRKLTPKECWRLMGFDDEDFEKAEKVNSNSQLYKQAGNSIVVNVLEEIIKQLKLKERYNGK